MEHTTQTSIFSGHLKSDKCHTYYACQEKTSKCTFTCNYIASKPMSLTFIHHHAEMQLRNAIMILNILIVSTVTKQISVQ